MEASVEGLPVRQGHWLGGFCRCQARQGPSLAHVLAPRSHLPYASRARLRRRQGKPRPPATLLYRMGFVTPRECSSTGQGFAPVCVPRGKAGQRCGEVAGKRADVRTLVRAARSTKPQAGVAHFVRSAARALAGRGSRSGVSSSGVSSSSSGGSGGGGSGSGPRLMALCPEFVETPLVTRMMKEVGTS
jgi:hypothetical protein